MGARHRPVGRGVLESDFSLVERPVPPLEDGQLLVRTLYLSVAPVMRRYIATMSSEVRTNQDFFPLTVDYEERMYAGGRIPGSFFRREGRPTEEAILTARLTDRPLRPLFPKDLRNDVQVILYSFSVDGENPIDVLAINAASGALMISDVPWGGPVAAVRIGRINGELVVNPTSAGQDTSDLDLRIAGTRDAILMVECGSREIPENVMVQALDFGHASIQPLIDIQEQMRLQIGKPKQSYPPFILVDAIQSPVEERALARLNEILRKWKTQKKLNSAWQELLPGHWSSPLRISS